VKFWKRNGKTAKATSNKTQLFSSRRLITGRTVARRRQKQIPVLSKRRTVNDEYEQLLLRRTDLTCLAASKMSE